MNFNKNKNYKRGVQQFNSNWSLIISQEWISGTNGFSTEIWNTAWWIWKTSQDFSLFRWLWTYNVPLSIWNVKEKWVVITDPADLTQVTSDQWALLLTADTVWEWCEIKSKRNIRYQPNRWQIFSTSAFLPNKDFWIRALWLSTADNTAAVFFKLNAWTLQALVRTTLTDEKTIDIDYESLWIDLSKWNLYDIQYQWRWVWNYYFYINWKLVATIDELWKLDQVSIPFPSLSVYFATRTTVTWQICDLRVWCVDVTSEGWNKENLVYWSVSNPIEKEIYAADTPLLIIYNPTTFKLKVNTRDSILWKVTVSADVRSYAKIYLTEDPTAIIWATFNNVSEDSTIKYDTEATSIDTAKCELIHNQRITMNEATEILNTIEHVDFFIHPWQYFIVTLNKENYNWNVSAVSTIQWWEEL